MLWVTKSFKSISSVDDPQNLFWKIINKVFNNTIYDLSGAKRLLMQYSKPTRQHVCLGTGVTMFIVCFCMTTASILHHSGMNMSNTSGQLCLGSRVTGALLSQQQTLSTPDQCIDETLMNWPSAIPRHGHLCFCLWLSSLCVIRTCLPSGNLWQPQAVLDCCGGSKDTMVSRKTHLWHLGCWGPKYQTFVKIWPSFGTYHSQVSSAPMISRRTISEMHLSLISNLTCQSDCWGLGVLSSVCFRVCLSVFGSDAVLQPPDQYLYSVVPTFLTSQWVVLSVMRQ